MSVTLAIENVPEKSVQAPSDPRNAGESLVRMIQEQREERYEELMAAVRGGRLNA